MYTLGHNFMPAAVHAGGLRYHGASVLCSQLLRDGLIEATAMQQLECFQAGVKFAQTEGIVPAPEAAHAIAQVVREAEQAKKEGKAKVIFWNSGEKTSVNLTLEGISISGRPVATNINYKVQ